MKESNCSNATFVIMKLHKKLFRKKSSHSFAIFVTNLFERDIESIHEDIKPFKCNICEHETTHIADLKKHLDSVHEGIQPYLGLWNAHKSILKRHRICSWRYQTIQVPYLWIWNCTLSRFKETRRLCSWRNQAIQLHHMCLWNNTRLVTCSCFVKH